MDLLKTLAGTPLPTILGVGGIIFLFLALVGEVTAKEIIIKTPPGTQKWFLGLGIALLLGACYLYAQPTPSTDEPTPATATVKATSTPTPTIASTASPSDTPPPPTPTTTPTSTPPSPTPTATPTPTPSPTCEAVGGPLAETWTAVQRAIGCATGPPIEGLIAEENFQGGKMFWREPLDRIQVLVLYNDGTWRAYQHAPYVEGSPEFSCLDADTPSQCPPTPKRGFGLIWCDYPEVRARLGDATDCERGFQGAMQTFDHGSMLKTDTGAVYVLYENGRWERR